MIKNKYNILKGDLFIFTKYYIILKLYPNKTTLLNISEKQALSDFQKQGSETITQ